MKRKPNRLDLCNYQQRHIYYLTLNCHNREKYFTNHYLVARCLDKLRSLKQKFDAKIWAYCFMPDHLHLMLETDDCAKFMKNFKQATGYYFKQQTGFNLWQKSYYDHILRKEEDIIGNMKYVLNNPARAGLVDEYLDYRFSGSLEIDIKDFVET